jgi:hypothetical protein
MEIYISEAVGLKLKDKHHVSEPEVVQCFHNRDGKFAYDRREEHQTNPPTLWFIAETDTGRRLKVVFMRYNTNQYVVKSAYDANADAEKLYQMFKQRGWNRG